MAIRWGIDLGGTKLEGVVLKDGDVGNPLCRTRIPTFSATDLSPEERYSEILERIATLVDMMCAHTGLAPDQIGFATPGTLDPVSGTMKNCNTTALNGKPLAQDLEQRLKKPVRLENDANCFALAETRFGAAQGADCVFGVIMGTGVGGGIVVNGKPLKGLHGIAGEWGHNVLVENGPSCYCGKNGCVETILSGPALEQWYFSRIGKRQSLSDIVCAASAKSDAIAEELIDRLCAYFGKALAVVINILDPDVVVLGGGVSNIDALYEQGLIELKKHIFNPSLDTRVVRNMLGDSAGVFGAALLELTTKTTKITKGE